MSVIPNEASVPELVALFNDKNFVSHGAIDVSLQEYRRDDLQSLHTASVGLMARLDTFLQDVMAQLEKSLADLRRSEKRITYQTNMLKNDVDSFTSEQTRVLGEISARVSPTLNSEALQKLSELTTAKERMVEVTSLLKKASELDAAKVNAELSRLASDGDWAGAEKLVEEIEQLVGLWKGTNEEQSRNEFARSLRKSLTAAKSAGADYHEVVSRLETQKI